jgi:hypothetical protein
MQTLSQSGLSTVDSLFTRLQIRYGSLWNAKWTGVDVELVKADWFETLGNLSPEAIRYGLANLPADYPPNVGEFLAICLRYEPTGHALIEDRRNVRPDLARMAQEMNNLREAIRTNDPKAWAYRLQQRDADRDSLSPAQRTMYRYALRSKDNAEPLGNFKGVPADTLPAGMREAAA